MKRAKEVETRHLSRGRAVPNAVNRDPQIADSRSPVKAGSDADGGGDRVDGQRRRERKVEADVQVGVCLPLHRTELPGDHCENATRSDPARYVPVGLNVHPKIQAGAGAGGRESGQRPTEEALRAKQLERGSARAIHATRPGPDAEALRTAYLELLKLSLCDLAGARTLSVSRTGDTRRPDSQVVCRELSDEERALRATGSDWPFSGLTMVGLERLDDLQACVETVVADGVDGDVIETGSWRGGAAILARATLDSLGADERTVWVADSFQGLPAPDADGFPEDRQLDLSQVGFLAVAAEEVRGHFARLGLDRGVELVEGFFDETLPRLRDRRWSIVRLDGDTYEATWLGLESLYPGLSAGGYLIVDDYGLIGECEQAVEDYRNEHGITEPIERIDWNGARWRRASVPATPPAPTRARVGRRGQSRAGAGPTRTHIPTARELELERELDELRARLRAVQPEQPQ